MSKPMETHALPHRQAEVLKEAIEHIETQIILCHDSICFHEVAELQHVADALFSLSSLMDISKQGAEALEVVLYNDFLASKKLLNVPVAQGGTA